MEGSVSLAERTGGGITTVLVWHSADNVCEVVVSVGDDTLRQEVPNESALDAFYHPGVYVKNMGWLLSPTRRAQESGEEDYEEVEDDSDHSMRV